MSAPSVRTIDLPAGRFRFLEWGGVAPAAVFLHGLGGIAEVWGPTVDALGAERPRCIALDQRGHGHSPNPPSGYGIGHYVEDAAAFIRSLKVGPIHLVGHSMGARVAIVLAARNPDLLRSVTVVDIGPEIWKENAAGTVAAFDRMPHRFATGDDAIAFSERRPSSFTPETSNQAVQARSIFFAGLGENADGSFEWLASFHALKQSVTLHRARDYWVEWHAIRVPAMLTRGGASTELRPAIAQRMRETNPRVRFAQFEGIGHNIPLLAPEQLATTLAQFWSTVSPSRS
jgi:pimeloyl-ACP methyl ester carboxylesterase